MKFWHRKYQSVAANTVVNYDYTPPSGEVIEFTEIGGNATNEPYVNVCIIWDPGGAQEEILMSCYQDATQKVVRGFTGDGTRKLRIKLDNQTLNTKVIGGYVIGDKYG